jgi:hypothetical protein
MKFGHIGIAMLAAATLANSASAHHAFNMYDNNEYTSLKGTVKTFTWQNPHAMMDFEATLPNGQTQVWQVELSAPNIIGRRGWSKNSLKAGDVVPLVLHPMKNGAKYGLLVSVTLADGTVLKDKA